MCKSGFRASSNRKVPLPPDCLKYYNYSSIAFLNLISKSSNQDIPISSF